MWEVTVDIFWHVGLGLSLLLGCLLTVFQLPGTWLILGAALIYAWHFEWGTITWVPLVVMALLATAAEIAEALSAMSGARKAGASRPAGWGALLGGFGGMIVFAPLIPLPIIGSVLGGLLGCFVGAFVVERHIHGDSNHGARVGFGAVVGRLYGLVLKVASAVIMSGIAVGSAIL
jgi:uncharacterized protein YqgC (DUF456 family)